MKKISTVASTKIAKSGMGMILSDIAAIVGKSDKKAAIGTALVNYSEKFGTGYRAAKKLSTWGEFLDELEEACDVQIPK